MQPEDKLAKPSHVHEWVVSVEYNKEWGFQPPDQDKRSILAKNVFCAECRIRASAVGLD